jgi:hypothetical protein
MEVMKPPREPVTVAVTGTKISDSSAVVDVAGSSASKSPEALEANEKPEKCYLGFPRRVFVGAYIASITIFFLNNVFTVLLFGPSTTVGLVAFFYGFIVDVVVLLPMFYLGYRGLQETKPEEPEAKGSWNVYRLTFLSTVFYFGYLWAIQSYYKYGLKISPVCPAMKDDLEPEAAYLQQCSWDHHRSIFFTHAMTGPAVLMLECFQYMKFSRGLVFSIDVHRWVGRVNNILVMIASVGAFGTAMITSTPTNTTSAFFVLLSYWLPTMLLGWYFVTQKNIKQHMRFMTRHFTGTCCAITLRVLAIFGTPYVGMVWGALPQIFVVEYYLQKQDDCDLVFWRGVLGLSNSDNKGLVKGDAALEK